MAAATSLPSWRHRLGESTAFAGSSFSVVGWVDVGAAAPSRWCLHVEAAVSGTMVGNSFMGRGCCLAWTGRQSCVARAARLWARSTRLSGGGLTLRRGGGPGCWCGGRGLRAVCHVQLGLRVAGACGVAARARAVVRRDGGPGRWCWWFARRGEAVGCRGGGLGSLTALRASTSCRVDDEVAFDVLSSASRWRSSCGGLAHSSHGVFASALMGRCLFLAEWCLGLALVVLCPCGLSLVVSVFARISVFLIGHYLLN